MSKLAVIKCAISQTAGRSGLILRKYSPEILVSTGVVGVIASTVMACRATTKAEDVMDKAKAKFDKIHQAKDTVDAKEYSAKDYKQDLFVVYAQTGYDFVSLYGPSVTLGVVSIACILGGHNILRKRNLAVVAAYKAVEQSFSDYRKRVVAKYGADEDRDLKYGITRETVSVTKTNDDGTTTEEDIVMETVDPNGHSEYARFFDESSSNWSKDPGYNMTFLKCSQNFANDMLHSKGHVFLNEVYDLVGVPRTEAGSVVGWIEGAGDDYVDFGIFDAENGKARDFVNGYERSILMDFNVDGIMNDKI